MGFTFRKRNPKGLNFSVSSRGARVSKTIKLGKLSFNLGRYIGGSHDGKTTARTTLSAGNGLRYEKNYTLGSKQVDTNPELTESISKMVDESLFPEKYAARPADEPEETVKPNPISRMYLSEWGPWVVIFSMLFMFKALNLLNVYNKPLADLLDAYNINLMLIAATLIVPWAFILPYLKDFDDLEWNNTFVGMLLIKFEMILAFIIFTLYIVPNLVTWLFTGLGWFFRA